MQRLNTSVRRRLGSLRSILIRTQPNLTVHTDECVLFDANLQKTNNRFT